MHPEFGIKESDYDTEFYVTIAPATLDDDILTPEDIEAIRDARAKIKAGEFITFEEFRKDLKG